MKKAILLIFIFAVFPICIAFVDEDSDGLDDEWESANGLNVYVNDANNDNDKDGLLNSKEYLYKTDPNSPDSDGDGVSDLDEIRNRRNPLSTPFISRVRGWSILPLSFGIIFIIVGLYFAIDKSSYWKIVNKIFYSNHDYNNQKRLIR